MYNDYDLLMVGDLHLHNEQPLRRAGIEFLEWLGKTFPGVPSVFTGDIYDSSRPHWDNVAAAKRLLRDRKSFFLPGNHEEKGDIGNALHSLTEIPHMTVAWEPGVWDFEGYDIHALPYRRVHGGIYNNICAEGDFAVVHFATRESYTELLGSVLADSICDDPKSNKDVASFVKSETAMDAIFHGHIHLPVDFVDDLGNSHYVVGVPYPQAYGEHRWKHRLIGIKDGKQEDIDVPQFINFTDVKFPTTPTTDPARTILGVSDAPSWRDVYNVYQGWTLRKGGISFKHRTHETNDRKLREVSFAKSTYTDLITKFRKLTQEDGMEENVVNFGVSALQRAQTKVAEERAKEEAE